MMALFRYSFLVHLRTFKSIPPLFVYLFVLMLNYTYTPNPILDSYSFTSIALFFIMGWITITIFHAEDEGQKEVTLMHARPVWRYHAALYTIALLNGFVLSILSVGYPLVIGGFGEGVNQYHVIMGVLAHFSLSVLSISLSALFTREWMRNPLNTWWGTLSVLILTLALASMGKWLAPVVMWFLPPLYRSLDIMGMGDDLSSISASVYANYGWILFYSVMLICVYFILLYRKRK